MKYFEIFKIAAILRSGELFYPEVVPKVEYNNEISSPIPYILSYWSTFHLKY